MEQRDLPVLLEALQRDLRAVAEGVAVINEKLDRRLQEREERFDRRLGPLQAVVRDLSVQVQDQEWCLDPGGP